MKTKLVYVLTCAEEANYIEMALQSVYSARYWNPDAEIVLLVDDKTDRLFAKRSAILTYISEKKVISFEDTSVSMKYRSRWIKTKVREFVNGDFLFIDCDTIICKSLNDIDTWEMEVGAVYESHLLVADFNKSLYDSAALSIKKMGVDLSKEKYYYSSGVLYVKDTPNSWHLYELWHSYWLEGEKHGLSIDQPSLLKADIACGHIIKHIPDTYNCILFTQNTFVREAHILHISLYRNPSYLFSDRVLMHIRYHGLSDGLKDVILRPWLSFFPFDYEIAKASLKIMWVSMMEIAYSMRIYSMYIDDKFEDMHSESIIQRIFVFLLRNKMWKSAAFFWLILKRMSLIKKRKLLKANICSK